MTEEMYTQSIHPLDRLIREKRMPILFIGSGLSQRYCSLTGWDALLQEVSGIIGLSRIQLNAMKSQLEVDFPEQNVNPRLASELSKILRSKLADGSLMRGDFKELNDEEWNNMETMDPFKVVIAHITSKIVLNTDEDIRNELESFKKLSRKIPAVITTNYDEFLEKYIFTDFSVLTYPDDYYFNPSLGYDEILKIHGSVNHPQSIVISEEDYQRLQKESKVITARLTSLMCQNPVIFLGYSLSDEEIHKIILDLVSSLKQTDLDKIRGHLIKASVRPNLHKSVWNFKTETLQGKKIEILQLEMPNFDVLYRYLDRFTPVATPHEIRKYQEMIRDIVLSTDPVARKIELIDVESIDKVKSGELAVIFGKSSSIGSMIKGILGYDAKDALLDVLLNRTGNLDTSSTHFTQWFIQKRICKSPGFVPVFHYLLKYDIDPNKLNDDAKTYINDLSARIEQKLKTMGSKCALVTSSAEVDAFLGKQTKSFSRCEALAYFHYADLLDREQCRTRLADIYNMEKDQFKESAQLKTDLRAAISMLDYKEYKLKRTEICTLSH